MNFHQTISFQFVQISTLYKVEIEKELKEYGLHSGQIFVLFELWKTEGLSQIELSKNLKLSPPTINKMIKSLEGNGFITCQKSSDDGRTTRIFLTRKAVNIKSDVETKWIKLEEKLVSGLTPTEQLVLSQLFDKVSENFAN